jgi:hypothetical protein
MPRRQASRLQRSRDSRSILPVRFRLVCDPCGGVIIGNTDRRGEEVIERRAGPHDFLATTSHHLGMEYNNVTLPDLGGRPVPIIRDDKAIPELVSVT